MRFFILFLLLLSGCSNKKDVISIDPSKMPFKINILENSREIVLIQDQDWENQLLGYYNVIKTSNSYKMWYTSWGPSPFNEFYSNFCYATSDNGKIWNKNISNISQNDSNNIIYNGILENFVFYDKYLQEYKLIGVERDSSKRQGTFLLSSNDGIHWRDKKLLYNVHFDTQFSVIVNKDNYIIYLRTWSEGYRSIGSVVIDKKLNSQYNPSPITYATNKSNTEFPHIYNNAASAWEDLIIFFPTLYNNEKDSMSVTVGYQLQQKIYFSKMDITEELFRNEKVKWGIVSPNLIPTGEKNRYWIYYYGSEESHFKRIVNKGKTIYFRIKIELLKS